LFSLFDPKFIMSAMHAIRHTLAAGRMAICIYGWQLYVLTSLRRPLVIRRGVFRI
jgi:hypothetical protein